MPRPDRDPPKTEEAPPSRLRRWLGHRWTLPLFGAAVSTGLAFALAGVILPAESRHEERPDGDPLHPDRIMDLRGFEPPLIVQIPKLEITLADETAEGFARLVLYVEVRARSSRQAKVRIEETIPVQIRDALNMHISGKYARSLRTTTGKELLKLELIDLLDPLIFPDGRDGKVTAVYYHEFMVR